MVLASSIKSLPQSWSGMLWLGPQKKKKRSVWKLFWKLDCLVVLNRSWTVYKRWVTSSWSTKESASCIQSLPQSWSGMLSDLVHQKTKRGVWKVFWNLDCLAAQNRSWIVYKRWVTDNWPTMVLASPIKSLPQSWPGPPKNKERCVKTVLESGLSCCTEQILNCVQEMGDW